MIISPRPGQGYWISSVLVNPPPSSIPVLPVRDRITIPQLIVERVQTSDAHKTYRDLGQLAHEVGRNETYSTVDATARYVDESLPE